MPFGPGEVIPYLDMCREEGASLQRGMNFRLHGGHSVVLMSRRPNAPYVDEVIEDGQVVIYEGHDARRSKAIRDPRSVDQPMREGRSLTQNGQFYEAAMSGIRHPVRVYEKLYPGVWVYNGLFELAHAWIARSGARDVFKFRLVATDETTTPNASPAPPGERTRVIPSLVKQAVWLRDNGRCVLCGSPDNLHFDHELPFSRGGSSTVENLRILCAAHNLRKSDRIE
ncbi:MAG: HNH endonuclease [Dehalococcoidia bacterium]